MAKSTHPAQSDHAGSSGSSANADDPFGCYDSSATSPCETLCADLFGRKLSCNEVLALVGAPEDAVISLRCGPHSAWLQPHGPVTIQAIMVWVTHEFYEVPQRRAIYRAKDDSVVMLNEVFQVRKEVAPPHTGTRTLARSVENILRYNSQVEARYRISKLRVHAFSRSDSYNGAYTWARLGYNARLDDINPNLRARLVAASLAPQYSAELREAMGEVETLNDLMLAGGSDLWRSEAEEFWGAFDLRPDSDAVRILRRYMAQKGIQLYE